MYELILISAIGSGLVAGIFFAFSNFIMEALGDIAPAQGIAAMNAINVTVINRWFVGLFLGTGIFSFVLVIASYFNDLAFQTYYLIAASVCYLIGTVAVTFLFNIPLNDELCEEIPSSAAGEQFWFHYLKRWTFWNSFRATAALFAMVLFLLSVYQ